MEADQGGGNLFSIIFPVVDWIIPSVCVIDPFEFHDSIISIHYLPCITKCFKPKTKLNLKQVFKTADLICIEKKMSWTWTVNKNSFSWESYKQ